MRETICEKIFNLTFFRRLRWDTLCTLSIMLDDIKEKLDESTWSKDRRDLLKEAAIVCLCYAAIDRKRFLRVSEVSKILSAFWEESE